MTDEDRIAIKKIQRVLLSIDRRDPIFFNTTQYERLGLVYSTKKHGVDAYGNPTIIGHEWHLTSKARQYINVVV